MNVFILFPHQTFLCIADDLLKLIFSRSVFTKLRDKTTSAKDFIFNADLIANYLSLHILNHLDYSTKFVETKTGSRFQGIEQVKEVIAVSIGRGSSPLETAMRTAFPHQIHVGKLLIHKGDNKIGTPRLFFSHFPDACLKRENRVVLVDTTLASANVAIMAVRVLLDHDVEEKSIIFACIIASPEGVSNLLRVFPQITIVVAAIDQGLDENFHVIPGLGSFGDRYSNTS